MRVRIDSRFIITLRNKDGTVIRVEKHNAITHQYQLVLQGLLTKGAPFVVYFVQGPGGGYRMTTGTGKFVAPSNMYFLLGNTQNPQGSPVALPAKLNMFNESLGNVSPPNCNNNPGQCLLNSMSFTIAYTAVDNSENEYTFNEIDISNFEQPNQYAMPNGEQYIIAETNINDVTKNSNNILGVSWVATITINSNGVFYMQGCTDPSQKLPYSVNLNGFQPLMCINLPYIIVALSLIPYNQIPQNSYLYQQFNNLFQVLGISKSGNTLPTQQLQLQGVTHYVINGVAYPIDQSFTASQTETVDLFLLYGINNNYFIYSVPMSQSFQSNVTYIPSFKVNIITDATPMT